MGADIDTQIKVGLGGLEEQLERQEGCRIIGTGKLHKVPSTIFVTTESYQWTINKLVQENKELA